MFKPKLFHESKLDSLIFYHEDTLSYERWINKYLSLFLSSDDDRLVGFEISGIYTAIDDQDERFIDEICNVRVETKDGTK